MTRSPGQLLARGGLLLILVACATICLLVDIPFTYQAVVRAGLMPWLPRAMQLLPWLLVVLAVVNAWMDHRAGHRFPRSPHGCLLGLLGFGGLMVGSLSGLARLQPGTWAQLGALISLAGLATLVTLDLWVVRGYWPTRPNGTDDARRLLTSSLLTALLVAMAFSGLGLARAMASGVGPAFRDAAATFVWSLVAHSLAFTLAAVGMFALQALAGLVPRHPRAEFLLVLGAFTGGVGAALLGLVFPGIAFSGAQAWVVALLLGYSLAAYLGQVGMAMAPPGTGGALEAFLRPLHPVRPSRISLGWGLAIALALTFLIHFQLSRFDWNQLFQQVGALLVAILVFAPLYLHPATRSDAAAWSPRLFATPICLLALFRLWGTPRIEPLPGWFPRPLVKVLEAHQGFDASTHLIATLLRPNPGTGESIYAVLLANSNIPHDVEVPAKDLELVQPLAPRLGVRPDIYIFVIDSLRQDYLGSYNRQVTFTPNLDRFAAESTVMPRAFTRYGATGLSEPSIWVGGMILHKQYIIPFHPLNTLQKLIQADGYRPYLSMDSILDVVVKPMPNLVPLDPGTGTGDLRLGTTLTRLEQELDRAPAGEPVFVYSQAQDLHISTLTREGKDVVGGGDYPGFYAPYASRVHRLDAQFGAFVQYLKDRGRYDRSLIIFTADHGDSLGEEGRFGHAYTLYPEIMKVPLLMHVPAPLRQGLSLDATQAAFLTDITPTLYYLLGHRPVLADPVLGRPIFTATKGEQELYRREHHLIASSYGAVWGILTGDGKTLYVSDGVNFRDHCFDLGDGPVSTRRDVTPELKQRYDRLILKEIDHLNAFYAFKPRKGLP